MLAKRVWLIVYRTENKWSQWSLPWSKTIILYRRHYRTGGQVFVGRNFEDWEPGRVINCNKCGKVKIVLVYTSKKTHVVLWMYPTKHRKKSLRILTYISSSLRLSLSQDWGMEIRYRNVVILPCLKIKSFSLKTPEGKSTPKQWKDVEFQVKEFVFLEDMSSRFPDLNLNDWHTI